MAVCSTAHSSGASRLALLQRAAQPGCGGVAGAGPLVSPWVVSGAAWAAPARALDLTVCASAAPSAPHASMAVQSIANCAVDLTERAPLVDAHSDVPHQDQSQVIRQPA